MSTPVDRMRAVAAVVTNPGDAGPGKRLAHSVRAELGTASADLCVLFVSAHFEDQFADIAADVQERLNPAVLTGMTTESVIHSGREYEGAPAVTLWVAHLPDVTLRPFHLLEEDIGGFTSPQDLRDYIEAPADERPSFLLLAEPFSFGRGLLTLLEQLATSYPSRTVVGGMASAGEEAGQNLLLFGGQALRSGVSGVAMWGNIAIESIVSQGCRPIGRRLTVTRAEENVIRELGGKRPFDVLTDVLRECRARDLELARAGGLLIGRLLEEEAGRVLIRSPLGFDQDSGAMVINDFIRPGQVVQFHVRDSDSADEDLAALLDGRSRLPAAGALLFTCNGRGVRLFNDRNHDARRVLEACGDLPLAGAFCAGEIGPLGDRSFLHGHTASIAIFRPETFPVPKQ